MDRAVIPDLSALRAASRAVLIAHTWKTLFALAVLGDFWLELLGIARGEDLIAVARHVMQGAPGHVRAALWALGAYALVGPLLQQYVLGALQRRSEPARSALLRYPRALVLSLLRALALATAGAGALLTAHYLPAYVAAAYEAPARWLPLALGAGQVLWLATIHDVAAAQLAAGEAPRIRRAILRGARASTPKLVLAHLAFIAAAALAYGAGEAASRVLAPAAGFMLSQAFALASSFAAAAWLATATTQTR